MSDSDFIKKIKTLNISTSKTKATETAGDWEFEFQKPEPLVCEDCGKPAGVLIKAQARRRNRKRNHDEQSFAA